MFLLRSHNWQDARSGGEDRWLHPHHRDRWHPSRGAPAPNPYRHSTRPDEAGIKFVQSEAEAVAEGRRLESLGFIVEKIAQTSKARIDAYLAGKSDRNSG